MRLTVGMGSFRLGGCARAFGFDSLCSRAEMMLLDSRLFLRRFLAPHIAILRVRLRQIAETEPLRELQLAKPLVVAAHGVIHAPLRIRGRTLASASEELLVLDF